MININYYDCVRGVVKRVSAVNVQIGQICWQSESATLIRWKDSYHD